MIKVNHAIADNGKKFIVNFGREITAQCAYCLFVQYTHAIRDPSGLVIGFDIKEEHASNCPQK